MSLTKVFIRVLLVVCTMLGSRAALAGPVRCSVNNQDSTCVGHLTTAWQTAPTCPSTPGYTTITPAKWIGSQYSAPVCNYQAPPVCPPATTQTSAPTWTGSSWTPAFCQPTTPPLTIVSATGFDVWEDCAAFTNGSKSGTMPVLLYQATWSDGSTSYYQYWTGQRLPVLPDSSGNFYLTSFGDNWPDASLYPTGAQNPDPSAPPPPDPAYACSGSNH
ncbi:conserved exported hypothetical protein [Paraburkholderia ribeironis]|uniref:Uncharacterized protein n=1 Tax=Paraburkholderia ribeironis TaxID=1247936 RepID=A0A1N7RJK5_9BURK|nr:conserved exported hypothetical protein [Paraburkholderia ribeironis]